MEYLVICLTSLGISGLTLFSGFSLGTVLMPAMAIFPGGNRRGHNRSGALRQ